MPADVWLYLTVVFGTSTAILILFLIFIFEKVQRYTKVKATTTALFHFGNQGSPEIVASKTRIVAQERVKEASERLRILNVEREILSYALRRLYEAHAEGRLTAEERDKLAERYKEELRQVREEIVRNESIITLDELERMQEDLIEMFTEKFNEINKKIEELRNKSGIWPLSALESIESEESTIKSEAEQEYKKIKTKNATEPRSRKKRNLKKEKGRSRRSETKLTDADRKVEQLRAEIEKALERLSRLEVED